MLIDSHCHLDYLDTPAVSGGVAGAVARSLAVGVGAIVLPAVSPNRFDAVIRTAHAHPSVVYALGIHPMYVETLGDEALDELQNALIRNRHDPKLIAVGEIGLDHYVPGLDRQKMERFYVAQCKMARELDLPVILHVRKSQDRVLKFLRQFNLRQGIAHAFNGSQQQAMAFVDQGLCLGFGGAMTFTRALQIRRLAVDLPLHAIVLETDSPDMSPAWKSKGEANEPMEVARIAQSLAELRGLDRQQVDEATTANVHRVLPGLSRLPFGHFG